MNRFGYVLLHLLFEFFSCRRDAHVRGVFSSIHQVVSVRFPCFCSKNRDIFVFAGKLGVWAVGQQQLTAEMPGLTAAHFRIPYST